MTDEMYNKVEDAFRNGDSIVFSIGNKVYVAENFLKHPKEATIEFRGCNEIDDNCFDQNGDYWGDVGQYVKYIILADHCVTNPNAIETKYFEDELIEMR